MCRSAENAPPIPDDTVADMVAAIGDSESLFIRASSNPVASCTVFGHPGAGGSLGFADPDAHLGFAYVMNKMDFYMFDDPREKALRDAIYRGIRAGSAARAA